MTAMDGSPPVRVAIVGLGYWGPNLVRNLHEVPGAQPAWVCDLRENALDAITRRYPAVQATTSFGEVLAKSDMSIASRYAELVTDGELRDGIFCRIQDEIDASIAYLLAITEQAAAIGWCFDTGVAITTASTESSASTSPKLVVACTAG